MGGELDICCLCFARRIVGKWRQHTFFFVCFQVFSFEVFQELEEINFEAFDEAFNWAF